MQKATIASIMNLKSEKGSDLTYKGIQKECIIRGMDFIDIITLDFWGLSNWLVENAMRKTDESLLDKYDDWMEAKLRKRGATDFIHPTLRMGYVKRDEEGEIKPKKEKVIKEKKAPREKDSNGLFKGTKKSYTYELQKRGKTLEQTMIKVKRKFPDAQDKSIRIWFNKSKKETE